MLGALLRGFVLPAALAGGIALQLVYPGEFAYRLEDGGPALVTWIAVVGGVAALVVGLVFLKHKVPLERPELAALAAALFVLPIAIHAAANWSPSEARLPSPLTPGSSRRCASRSRAATSSTPIPRRATGSPPPRRSTSRSRRPATSPTRRRTGRTSGATKRAASSRPATPRSRGGPARTGSCVDRERFDVAPDLDSVYRDDRFTLYVVP